MKKQVKLDNKDYLIKDKIKLDNIYYYFLINTNNINEVIIRKENKDKELVSLKDEEEFNKIMKLFLQRNAF